MREKSREWKEIINPDMAEHLVFLNESGVNTDLIRRYGRVSSSQRAVNHTLLNTPQTTTVLSSIHLNGEKVFTAYQGRTTREHFVQYLKKTLLPTLQTGDIAAMDNMRSHHVKAVRDTMEAKGKMAFKKDVTSRIFQGISCFARIFCLSIHHMQSPAKLSRRTARSSENPDAFAPPESACHER